VKECKVERNRKQCSCSYEPCSRKGVCCDCLEYHWSLNELPACLFPASVERTYDRSLRRFISLHKDKA